MPAAPAPRGGGGLVEVRPTRELEQLAKRLKDAGRGDLRKRMLAGIRAEAKPAIPEIRQNAREVLPHRGGLYAIIANSKIGVRTRTSGRSVGVTVQANNPHDIRSLNAGRLRHPLYGDKDHWFSQSVEPGWFDKPLIERAPDLRTRIKRVLDDVGRDLTRGL